MREKTTKTNVDLILTLTKEDIRNLMAHGTAIIKLKGPRQTELWIKVIAQD